MRPDSLYVPVATASTGLLPVRPWYLAVMTASPGPLAVARPPGATEIALVLLDVQAAVPDTFSVDPSDFTAVAVSCADSPGAIESGADTSTR
jgi:hypothetical protein